ncbi:hypothetical protein HAX54_000697 [Datura stramonium]|uniref:F-box domain-containing protein n=1 Tax=Datura stramonium TaxID=4076 RepID=A0ABS8T3K5_DATST|nr:hypothetical protein [Datura stramonium]
MSVYIPDWLLPEILCRLPVESLLRFRCVSKQWYSLISSPDFISLYTSAATAPPLLILPHFSTKPKKQEKYSVYSENLTLVKELVFPFKRSSKNYFRVIGFCNGLFCLCDDIFRYTSTIILWNPAIRKSVTLPKPPPHDKHMFWLGLGFDPKNFDLKVVRIAYLGGPNGGCMKAEVYKLSTCLWTTVYSKTINYKLDINHASVYFNGSVHWVSQSKNEDGEITNSLLVFNLSDETVSEMGFPHVLAQAQFSSWDLSVTLYGEHISLIWYPKSRDLGPQCDSCVVWVMNQYGKLDSWMEKFVVDLNGGISDAIGFTRNGEFLVVQYPGNLLSYDPESREFKDLDIHGRSESFFLSKYVESLVLLDGSSGATADPSIAPESEEATELKPESGHTSRLSSLVEVGLTISAPLDARHQEALVERLITVLAQSFNGWEDSHINKDYRHSNLWRCGRMRATEVTPETTCRDFRELAMIMLNSTESSRDGNGGGVGAGGEAEFPCMPGASVRLSCPDYGSEAGAMEVKRRADFRLWRCGPG